MKKRPYEIGWNRIKHPHRFFQYRAVIAVNWEHKVTLIKIGCHIFTRNQWAKFVQVAKDRDKKQTVGHTRRVIKAEVSWDAPRGSRKYYAFTPTGIYEIHWFYYRAVIKDPEGMIYSRSSVDADLTYSEMNRIQKFIDNVEKYNAKEKKAEGHNAQADQAVRQKGNEDPDRRAGDDAKEPMPGQRQPGEADAVQPASA